MQRSLFRTFLPSLAASVFLAASPHAMAQTGAASADAGSRIYTANCAVCHQAAGTGMAGAFPPLAGPFSELLKRSDGRTYVGKLLLFGLEGEINVNGNNFAGTMPAWNALSDDD